MVFLPTRALHQHNEHHKVEQFIRYLDAGQDLALITDAGMPEFQIQDF